MTAPEITAASPADREQAVASLVAAFVKDPVLRYLFPDDASYPQYAAAFFGHLFDKRVGQGTIWTIGHGASLAMWDAPHATGEPAADALADRRPAEALARARSTDALADRLPADALARVDAYERALFGALPAAPYWYLGVLGTHPDYAGRRWGHAVMEVGLRRAAAAGLPAILETGDPANVEVYRRAGWQVRDTLAVGPLPIWVMRNG